MGRDSALLCDNALFEVQMYSDNYKDCRPD